MVPYTLFILCAALHRYAAARDPAADRIVFHVSHEYPPNNRLLQSPVFPDLGNCVKYRHPTPLFSSAFTLQIRKVSVKFDAGAFANAAQNLWAMSCDLKDYPESTSVVL